MAKDKFLEHLAQVPLFSALSKKEIGLIGRLADVIDVKDGYELTKEGATGREFFVIDEGNATVHRGTKKVATLGPGDFFGELSLIDGGPRNATVKASGPTRVVVIGQREFLGLLDEIPNLDFKIMKALVKRLRDADARAIQ